jgi:hypothetical protein
MVTKLLQCLPKTRNTGGTPIHNSHNKNSIPFFLHTAGYKMSPVVKPEAQVWDMREKRTASKHPLQALELHLSYEVMTHSGSTDFISFCDFTS